MQLTRFQPSHTETIKQLFTSVFSDNEGASEGKLIGNLTEDVMTTTDAQDLDGFIAIKNNQTIGCILLTRLSFESDINAFLLSPVAIHTKHQRQGIGQQLIHFGIRQLKENGVSLLLTYGDPAFYTKVGFTPISEKVVKAPFELSQPEGWLAQSLVGGEVEAMAGKASCVAAFNNAELW